MVMVTMKKFWGKSRCCHKKNLIFFLCNHNRERSIDLSHDDFECTQSDNWIWNFLSIGRMVRLLGTHMSRKFFMTILYFEDLMKIYENKVYFDTTNFRISLRVVFYNINLCFQSGSTERWFHRLLSILYKY